MEGTLTMSTKEIERVKVLSAVTDKRISQATAAKKLKICDRQLRRILKEYKKKGEKSIISKKIGKFSNRCIKKNIKAEVLKIVSANYSDFGPSLANEYLRKNHQFSISMKH